MHSELMRSQSAHTTTDLSTLRTLRHLSRDDDDDDALREVPHPSNEGLALQARVSGP